MAKDLVIRRLQASNVCISIYLDMTSEEVKAFPTSVVRAWEIGKHINEIVADSLNYPGASELRD